MKPPKILVLIVSKPITFIVSLFVSWISFSALATLSDDPFIYGTWPNIVAAASIQRAISLIIGEIVGDFAYEGYKIAVPCAFIISWRAARGHLKGIAKERQIWIPWYHQQEKAITEGRTLEESPLSSKHKRTNAYFVNMRSILLYLIRLLMFFTAHFSCWFSAFVLFVIIIQPSNEITETFHYLVNSFPDFAIMAIIHAFLSSYQETIGRIKGAAKKQQMWIQWYEERMKWYDRQQGAKTHGYALPEAPPVPPLDAYN